MMAKETSKRKYNKYGRYFIIDFQKYIMDNKLTPLEASEKIGYKRTNFYNLMYGKEIKEAAKNKFLEKVPELEKYTKEV